ncbi:adenylate kinase 8 [Haematobia irritans]|uniref:adenylate kinase 8 n=1 Tax=Haematobia irritans TaxID=7368 RepID=UPI003F507E98
MHCNTFLTQYCAEIMMYFEKHKLIEIFTQILVECALERPYDINLWIIKNIKRIAATIHRSGSMQGKRSLISSLKLSSNFLYRVVIYGRRGSGRKTQALYLAKRFNLVYLDAEFLINQYLSGDDENSHEPLARELQQSFYNNNCHYKGIVLSSIIAKRILERDCLSQGWVLVNFPNTLHHFKEILEDFDIPPNKVVYLRCPENICMQRLVNMPNSDEYCFNFYQKEMYFFNRNKSALEAYLKKRYETIYINGSTTSLQVKNEIFSKIEKYPYPLGIKHDIRYPL